MKKGVTVFSVSSTKRLDAKAFGKGSRLENDIVTRLEKENVLPQRDRLAVLADLHRLARKAASCTRDSRIEWRTSTRRKVETSKETPRM